ncbi:hypothetical protein Vretimale_3268 [Volvox reticuliferus]|uniref:Anaphase-promoting complex subunit 4 WD40 domain-containing protein n=1 Tax=Volvox reticuliferus TaxID=1737510 RepID=A0A8J4FLF1_9CHLO|nr:hypothetical protein Vretifemale_6547 [Volvox reticuliferus]GIL97683.1 hypothetical protein Vretimale_3268 [Volvox reticuliferus]
MPLRGAMVAILDTATGKVVSRHQLTPGKRVTASAWAHAAAGGRTYTFATAAAEEVTMWTLDPFAGQLAGRTVVLGSVRREYTCLLFSPDSNWLYGGTTSSDVVTINVQRLSVQMAHPVCSSGVGALLPAPDDNGATIVAGRDGTLSTFNATGGSWRELRPFSTAPGTITSLSLSSDKSAFLLGTAQGAVLRLDRATLQFSTISQSQGGSLTGVSFAAGQPEAVAVSSMDGSIAVWNVQDFTLQCKAQEPAQAGGALCCVMTRDTIMSGWGDGNIRCHGRTSGGAQCPPLWVIPGAHSLAHSVGVTAMKLSHGLVTLVCKSVSPPTTCSSALQSPPKPRTASLLSAICLSACLYVFPYVWAYRNAPYRSG